MNNLNEQQEMAVKTTEGYIRVIAGAGSGKTKVITERYIYLVNQLGVSNSTNLCVTFTNNAAKEMKKRIDKRIKDKDVGYICTFHSLAVKALREDIHCIGIVPNFSIMDEEDQLTIFKRIYKKLGISNRDVHYSDMKKAIGVLKDTYLDYIKYLGSDKQYEFLIPSTIEEAFFNEYLEEQRQNAMLDYFDLISTFEYILINFDDKREKWQKKFQYIMCDEFNDVDSRQYNILKILSAYHKNLMIVGDPDQTIYSWRGSDVKYIIEFANEFENVQDIVINTNYRSVPSVLKLANSIIKHNQIRLDKDLIPNRTEANKVVYNSLENAEAEATWIAKQIKKLKDDGEKLSDIAILYRNNNISRALEEALIQNDIKYVIYCGIDFYNRKEIKDIISYLRFLLYEKNIDFERIINVPKRGVGKKTMDILKENAKKNDCSLYQALKNEMQKGTLRKTDAAEFIDLIEYLKGIYQNTSIIDLVNIIVEKTGLQETLSKQNEQDRIENIEELKHSIIEFQNVDIEEKTLEEYLDKIALYTNNDRVAKEDAVKMMTIHASKGLEFKNVFVCRLNEGIMPSARVRSQAGIEEERRLCYVAITRAKDRLFLTDVQKDFGDYANKPAQFLRESQSSRFLLEADKSGLEFASESAKYRLSYTRKLNVSPNDNIEMVYKEGDRIKHTAFGTGTIVHVDTQNKVYGIEFDGFKTARSISAHIKLEKIDW